MVIAPLASFVPVPAESSRPDLFSSWPSKLRAENTSELSNVFIARSEKSSRDLIRCKGELGTESRIVIATSFKESRQLSKFHWRVTSSHSGSQWCSQVCLLNNT